jgi:hypothetical protein
MSEFVVARGASEEQGTSDHISGMSPLLVVPAARTSDSEVPTVGRATAQTHTVLAESWGRSAPG